MKVPKQIVREAQLLAVNLSKSGVITSDTYLWTHAMGVIKQRYLDAKRKANQYGFVPESREVTHAITGCHRVQSEGGSRRPESNVPAQSLARRHFAGRVLSALRRPKTLGGAA